MPSRLLALVPAPLCRVPPYILISLIVCVGYLLSHAGVVRAACSALDVFSHLPHLLTMSCLLVRCGYGVSVCWFMRYALPMSGGVPANFGGALLVPIVVIQCGLHAVAWRWASLAYVLIACAMPQRLLYLALLGGYQSCVAIAIRPRSSCTSCMLADVAQSVLFLPDCSSVA